MTSPIVVGRTALLYRRQYPGAVPGRIRDHHANTLDLITKSRPDGVFVGPYSLWSKKEDAEKVRMEDDEKCVVWLDTQEVGSVVFVGFGSFCCFSKEQHWEMAWGLEASGRPFLWALKEKKLAGDSAPWLPEGFEERVRGRGRVVRGWVPQVAILNHPATGAFVTYLGWSSLTEGLIAGVPMISWPLAYDEFINERLVLNILRVGLRMWDGYRSSLPEEAAEAVVKAEAISRVVSRFAPPGFADQEVEAVRKRAAACRATTRAAVKEGGTAYNDLTRLIDGQKAFSPEAEWGGVCGHPQTQEWYPCNLKGTLCFLFSLLSGWCP
ncbi:unnamed protein product [Spirodela intermedia]|uniref:Uncharacterized protein n=1 Tax=Spirodela intermedia TaxID=51605 RepID=A0A7I8KD08_SPIIN|nr:unnamed protein product [Spirodela intermedia]